MSITFKLEKKLGSFSLNVQGDFSQGLIGIFGKSGSGKTSLLNCLAGFLRPDAGEIKIQEETIFSDQQRINLPIEQRKLGVVLQDPLLFPHRNVQDNICFALAKKPDKKDWARLVDVLNIHALLERSPQNLSGGECQRVALARALVRQPRLLVMDEPVSSLDLEARSQILIYLKKIHQEFKVPLIYVSHSISEMMFLTKEVLLLDQGQSVDQGSPLNILLNQSKSHLVDPIDIENIFDLPVLEFQHSQNLAILDLGGVPLKVTYYSEQVRPSLRIGIRATDMIVATKPLEGISARNIIAVQLDRIVSLGGKVILYTSLAEHTFLVEITPTALNELALKHGQTIYLLIKARSIVILE